jgi:hypothetical protein
VTTDRQPLSISATILALHILYLAPIFWFTEVAQNVLWHGLFGKWGWYYPASPYHWFAFRSLILWAGAVGLIWALEKFLFAPRQLPFWQRVLIGGVVTWCGEWLGGFLGARLGFPMQVWPDTALVYVHPAAILFWWFNVCLYYLLGVTLVRLVRQLPASSGVGAT